MRDISIPKSVAQKWAYKLVLDPLCAELFIDDHLGAGLPECGILLGGVSHLAGQYFVRQFQCKYHTLIYSCCGQAELQTPQGSQLVNAGSLLLLPAGSSFSYGIDATLAPPHNTWEIVWFLIDDMPSWVWLKDKGVRLLTNMRVGGIYHLAMALHAENISVRPATELVSQNALLIEQYIRRDLQADTPTNNRKQQDLVEFFHQLSSRLQQTWTQSKLAELAGYSPAHFNRLCLAQLECTPMVKLRQMRMQRAMALLKTTELKLSDIAHAVGYRDVFNFSAAFKRVQGCAPATYRARCCG